MRLSRTTDGEAFAMSWTEREGPPASQLKQRGFGTVVVEALGAAQWDGGSAGDDLRGLR